MLSTTPLYINYVSNPASTKSLKNRAKVVLTVIIHNFTHSINSNHCKHHIQIVMWNFPKNWGFVVCIPCLYTNQQQKNTHTFDCRANSCNFLRQGSRLLIGGKSGSYRIVTSAVSSWSPRPLCGKSCETCERF